MSLVSKLYFIFGPLSIIAFGSRTLLQWFLSERAKKSLITKGFWYISIWGNIFSFLHFLVQTQFHLFVIRVFLFYFTVRQLNLMSNRAKPFSFPRLFKSLTIYLTIGTLLFAAHSYLQYHQFYWVLNPKVPWQKEGASAHYLWHTIGFIGATLFSFRMWVQWIQSERAQKSYFSSSFWIMSIVGGVITFCYAIAIKDLVLMLSYGTGLIPYTRNLVLLNREKQLKLDK